MKRTLLVFLALALVSSFAFAEVTGVDAPAVSGSVTTTFGYSLDNQDSGFQNDASVDVVVPLAAGSDTHSGSGDVYAAITIDDIDISLSTDDKAVSYDASVSAKIVMGALYFGLGNPSLDFNNVDLDNDPQTDGDDSDVNLDVNADAAGADGVSIGYMTDAFSFEFGIASKHDAYLDDATSTTLISKDASTDWLDSNETDEIAAAAAVVSNVDNEYVFGANASVVAGPATVPVYFAYDATYTASDALMGFGAAPSIAAGDLTINIPVDYVSVGSDYGLEAKPALSYAIAGVGTVAADFFYAKYDIAAYTAITNIMETGVTFTEGFSDALAMVVDFDLTGLGADAAKMGWNVNVDLSYDMGVAAPYVTVDYGDNKDLDLSVGAVFATLIDNASITLDYTNGHLLADGTAGDTALKGVVTAAVTVAY